MSGSMDAVYALMFPFRVPNPYLPLRIISNASPGRLRLRRPICAQGLGIGVSITPVLCLRGRIVTQA